MLITVVCASGEDLGPDLLHWCLPWQGPRRREASEAGKTLAADCRCKSSYNVFALSCGTVGSSSEFLLGYSRIT